MANPASFSADLQKRRRQQARAQAVQRQQHARQFVAQPHQVENLTSDQWHKLTPEQKLNATLHGRPVGFLGASQLDSAATHASRGPKLEPVSKGPETAAQHAARQHYGTYKPPSAWELAKTYGLTSAKEQAAALAAGTGGSPFHILDDLRSSILGLPAGVLLATKSSAQDLLPPVIPGFNLGQQPTHLLHNVLEPMAKSTLHDFQHPLSHPVFTALDLGAIASVGAGAAAKGAEIGNVARAADAVDEAQALRRMSRAERRAHSVLLDPEGAAASGIDPKVLGRIAQPSKNLLDAINTNPVLAENRTSLLKAAGQKDLGPAPVTTTGRLRAVGRAAMRPNPPSPRRIVIPGENGDFHEVTLPTSKNHAYAAFQRWNDRRTAAAFSKDNGWMDIVPPETLPGKALGPFSSQAKVGRELSIQKAMRDAQELAAPSELERFGKSQLASVAGRLGFDVGGLKPRSSRLSAGEQKAIDIIASDVSPAGHIAYHENQIERGIGDRANHELQIALSKAAQEHLANPRPALQRAIELARSVSNKGAEIKDLPTKRALRRLGARALEIETGQGSSGSVIEELNALRREQKALKKYKGSKHAAQIREVRGQISRLEKDIAHAGTSEFPGSRVTHNKKGTPINPYPETMPGLEGLTHDAQREQLYGRLDQLLKSKKGLRGQRLASAEEQRLARIEEIQNAMLERGQKAAQSGGFYVKQQALAPDLVRAKGSPASSRPGAYGYSPPTKMTQKLWEGHFQRTGNFRTDVTGLVARDYRMAQRYSSLFRGFDVIRSIAKDSVEAAGGPENAVPVRETREIPPELRKLIASADRGELSEKDAELIGSGTLEKLAEHLFPKPEEVIGESGIKWVDNRILERMNAVDGKPGTGGQLMDSLNAPLRAGTLYAKPAYVVNLLQNMGTNVIQQGVWAPTNWRRALRLGKDLGPDTQHEIFALVGESLSRSYEPGSGLGKRSIDAAAEFWNAFVDRVPRVASWLHEARREGFVTKQQIDALLHDPRHEQTLIQVTRKANREAIEYGNLSPLEKNVFKRAVFFYPWLRGATMWSLRFPLEHPVQAAAYAHLGQVGSKYDKDMLGVAHLPAYLEGIVPLTGGDHPYVINPTSVNTFQTPLDLAQGVIGLTQPSRNPYASSLAGEQGPAMAALYTLLSGKTTLGYDLPASKSRLQGAGEELVSSLPPVPFTSRWTKDNSKSVMRGGPESAIVGYLGGSLAGGHLNKAIAAKKGEIQYRASLDPVARAHYDTGVKIDSLPTEVEALSKKGIKLPESMVRALRDAIRLEGERSVAYAKLGSKPSAREKAKALIENFVPADRKAALTALLSKTTDDKLSVFNRRLWQAFGGDTAHLAEFRSALKKLKIAA